MDEHKPASYGLQRSECVNTPETWVSLSAHVSNNLSSHESSETTIDRFISMYHFPDKIRSGDLFNATVLGFVKALQASLTIFGMFDFNYERNGLLCDVTVDGIQKWVAEIGEPHIHVEVGTLL